MDLEPLLPELARLRAMLADAPEGLVDYLRAITNFALLEVPNCVGVSITVVDEGVPYTISASSPRARVADGAQYLTDDGPCVATATDGFPNDLPDILNEQRWHTYAMTAAAQGIRSSLSLPLLFEGEILGALNLYGSTPNAFDDRSHMLAEIISGHAELAIRNADLSMRTAELANASTPDSPDPIASLDQAVGILIELRKLDPKSARTRLQHAARRAGIDEATLATALIDIVSP